jgi:hypothetical protein
MDVEQDDGGSERRAADGTSAYLAGTDPSLRCGAKKALKRKGVLSGGDQLVRFQRARIVSADGQDMSWRVELPNGVAVSFAGAVDGGSLSLVLNTVAHLG